VVGVAVGFAALALRKGELAMIKAKGSKKHAANFAFLFIKASVFFAFRQILKKDSCISEFRAPKN
jgi:uncharacterized membrane protein YhfC